MNADREETSIKGTIFTVLGIVLFAAVAFVVGYNLGQSRQQKNDVAGNLVLSLHYLNVLEATNLEKLDRDLRFSIYANVDMQKQLGGLVTNDLDPRQLARVSEIHNQMRTQVVVFAPEQLMTNVSGK